MVKSLEPSKTATPATAAALTDIARQVRLIFLDVPALVAELITQRHGFVLWRVTQDPDPLAA